MAVRFLFWCLTRHPAEMAMIKSKKNKDAIHYLVETNLQGLLIIFLVLISVWATEGRVEQQIRNQISNCWLVHSSAQLDPGFGLKLPPLKYDVVC